MDPHVTLIIVLAVVNLPVYYLFYKLVFKDLSDFGQSVKYCLMPNLFSLFRGEYFKDQWATLKMVFFVVMCVGAVAAEAWLLAGWFLPPAGAETPINP